MNLNNTHWACEFSYLETFIGNLPKEISSQALNIQASEDTKYQVIGNTAIIPIKGMILKTIPKYFKYYSIVATSTVDTQNLLKLAVNDPNVKNITLNMDSPGGSISGLLELVSYIKEVNKKKPIETHVDGMAASAAYWIASQTKSIKATQSSTIGSIGVYTVLHDFSKMYGDMGIKAIIIRSGEHKGVGTPGVEISLNNIDAQQDIINNLANQFMSSVSDGRNIDIEKLKPLADGRWWLAKEAQNLGLIDSIINASIIQEDSKMDENQFNALMQAVTGLTATVKDVAARVDQIEDSSKKNEAKTSILEQGLKTTVEMSKEASINKALAEGKAFAGNIEALKMFASKSSLEELDTFIATLPKVTKEILVADIPEDRRQIENAGDKEFSSKFRISMKDIASAAEIITISADGMATLADGTVKKLSEVI